LSPAKWAGDRLNVGLRIFPRFNQFCHVPPIDHRAISRAQPPRSRKPPSPGRGSARNRD
jgi:hypothetical protein